MKSQFSLIRYPLLSLLCMLVHVALFGQLYQDYYGNGHNAGMKVRSSFSVQVDDPIESITGTGILPDAAGASRFLSQAAFGHDYDDIRSVTQLGIENWIDEQMQQDYEPFSTAFLTNQQFAKQVLNDSHNEGELNTFTFYTKIFTDSDKLRQKMAGALLQIFVVSMQVPQVYENGYAASTYYDIFYRNAFGNYRDILEMVTLHPMMGIYLSHFRNGQANYSRKTYPDENYAREVMQLFSIGLIQLNLDGTPKLDSEGKEIPTYDNDDIREMAKVFTGLAGGLQNDGDQANFEDGTNVVDLAVPMRLFPVEHDITEKTVINNVVLPAGRSNTADLDETLDLLFNHPNVGPFISIRLIQQFVKSNPSPAYVKRIASVFNDNGKDVRGDLGAVIKAILLDPEARNCEWIELPESGKLLPPMERFTKLFSALKLRTPSDKFFLRDEDYSGRLGQAFFNAPSVFNFYTPFFAEEKIIKPSGMVSPEFEVFNSVTSVDYFNLVEDRIKTIAFANQTRNDGGNLAGNKSDAPIYNFKEPLKILDEQGLAAMLNYWNILLCRGQMSNRTNSIIQNTLQQYQSNIQGYTQEDMIRDALYFIAVSPDFIIQK